MLGADPLVGVGDDAREGHAAHEREGFPSQRPSLCAAGGVGLAGEALEVAPVARVPLEEVAAGDGGVGEVLGPDAGAQLGEVGVDGLAAEVLVRTRVGAQGDQDLLGTAAVRVVEGEVVEELLDDAPVARLAHANCTGRAEDEAARRPVDPDVLALGRCYRRLAPVQRRPRSPSPWSGSGSTVPSLGLGATARSAEHIGCRRGPNVSATEALGRRPRRRPRPRGSPPRPRWASHRRPTTRSRHPTRWTKPPPARWRAAGRRPTVASSAPAVAWGRPGS